MRRLQSPIRPDWRARVESDGLAWHTVGDRAYWEESVHYRFAGREIERIEAATSELYRLFLEAGQAVVDDPRLMARFGIPDAFHQPIREAWDAEPPALNHGRFDLGYDGAGPPRLFEFNCDTPTALLEAAVIQWTWRNDVFPRFDQFNSLHERLVARWAEIRPRLPSVVHFAHVADPVGEDAVTTAYLRDTARAAGLETTPILMRDVGWNAATARFVDLDETPIDALFKLYPWEWMANEAFAPQLLRDLAGGGTAWMEPVWKMIWSNKAILAVLWDLFPNHENLLEASFDPLPGDQVVKPLLSREGANVTVRRDGRVVAETGGDYGGEGWIHQAAFALPETAQGCFPVLGSWIVDGAPAGMGIREDGPITGNAARFVPHVIE